ncbi:TlpA family protein disulfide reductase [Chryseolinea soli]|nr:thioredoxin-like domain-containing protein [Chryseolinea soli]
MKYLITILCTLFAHATISAQTSPPKSKFKLGDQLPAITVKNLINYHSSTENLTKFKGKTVILYFWNDGCASSIQGWPKLLHLQEQFKNHVQIILVNESQDKKAVQDILTAQRKISHVDMTLPTVCLDRDLNVLFPRNSIPHLVWIDTAGKLMAITSGDQLNAVNLGALAEGRAISMPQKDGVKYRVDFAKPLFIKSNGGDGDFVQWQSILSEYFPGLTGEFSIDSTSGTISNSTMITMFRFLHKRETDRLGSLNLFPASRVVLKVKDTAQYMIRVNDELKLKNFYTYQLYSKKPKAPSILRSMMVVDIKKYFGVECYWSKQRKLCLVLAATDTSKFPFLNGETMAAIRPTGVHLNNVTFKEFLDAMLATEYHHSPYPLIDETGYKGKVGNIIAEANVVNHQDLNRALNKYGLQFTLQPREVDILVIYETDYFKPQPGVQFAN